MQQGSRSIPRRTSLLGLSVAATLVFAFTAHAQWQEPSSSPPQGLPPGFVWLQGATTTAQVGNISLNGSATFGPVSFSGDAQGVQVTASSAALRLHSNRDVIVRLNADTASDGADADGTFLIESGVVDAFGKANIVYQMNEHGTSEQRGAVDPVTGVPQFMSMSFDGVQRQIVYDTNERYFAFRPIGTDPMNQGVSVSGGRIHVATDAASGMLSSSGDLVLYASGGVPVAYREGLRVKGDTGNVQIGTLCLSGVCQSTWPAAGGGGSVTSVGLSMPSPIFAVSGSPVTGSGTLTATWNNQNPNLVLAGPASGTAAAPTFRNLVAADIPDVDALKIASGTLSDVRLSSNVALLDRNPQTFTGANTFGSVGLSGTSQGQVLSSTRNDGTADTATLLLASTENVSVQVDNDAADSRPSKFQVFGKKNITNGGDTIPDLLFEVTEQGALTLQNASGSALLRVLATTGEVGMGTAPVSGMRLTVGGRASVTGAPVGSGVLQGTLTVNPASAAADTPLFAVAVNGLQRFRVDAEGDLSVVGGISVSGGRSLLSNPVAEAKDCGVGNTLCLVLCPTTAPRLVGGGCEVSTASTTDALLSSFPSLSGSGQGWQCLRREIGGSIFRAHALCTAEVR